MVDVYKSVAGKIRVTRAVDSRVIGDIRAWVSRDTEVRDCEGNRYPNPRVNERIKFEVVREGQVVAFGEFPIDELIGSMVGEMGTQPCSSGDSY